MTKEEMINSGEMFLEANKDASDSSAYKFVDTVVKLIKQEPSEDAVSKKVICDALRIYIQDERR